MMKDERRKERKIWKMKRGKDRDRKESKIWKVKRWKKKWKQNMKNEKKGWDGRKKKAECEEATLGKKKMEKMKYIKAEHNLTYYFLLKLEKNERKGGKTRENKEKLNKGKWKTKVRKWKK